MDFPKKLVNRFGAKAGILMYVAKELPEIPQAKMIVKTPDESIDSFLKRADDAKIDYPRIFRSSAVAELDGYEGRFPTCTIFEPNSWFYRRNYPRMNSEERMLHVRKIEKEDIDMIQKSPIRIKRDEPGKHDNLPDEISVIAAEQSPSSIVGTYIKHPNQDNLYVISISTENSIRGYDPEHSAFTFSPKQGIRTFEGFSHNSVEESEEISDRVKKAIPTEMKEVVSWHDKITKLPLMDLSWTYQIEFGLDPVCLYQVRPFKKIEKASFKVKPMESEYKPLVIGITPKEGINVRAEIDVWKRNCDKEKINPENHPSLFLSRLRGARSQDLLPNTRVNVLTQAYGILAHKDIYAIRKADISAIFASFPGTPIEQGKWYNVRSDGKNIQIKEI